MDGVKKNFGFGFMRLPQKNGVIDTEQVCRMVDTYLANGFNYFDTAHGYHMGKSELALRDCLTSRYDRSQYIITNKLTNFYFKKQEDIRPFFEQQLKDVGVDYFDYYLMHAQGAEVYEYFRKHHAYETALELMAEGKFKHFGISFHDKAEVLEQILTDYPQIEVVQIQFNYLDYENEAVESRRVYEVCRKFGKEVIVMEPVKGGTLARLPEDAKKVLTDLNPNVSPASYAIRFAAGFEGIAMVLSGMSDMAQLEDNLSYMKDFQPLNEEEMKAVGKVVEILQSKGLIPCTACRYCVEGCPKKIRIPDMFACMNNLTLAPGDWNAGYYYDVVLTKDHGKASDCIKCGKCEKACPQHLEIRKLLEDVAGAFEKH